MVTTRLSGTTGQAGFGTGIGATALGGTNSLVSLDALQEFRIETSSYAAEFGRASGGQVSLVTRSGTNDVTGSVSYYFRNEALDANNWFANANRQPKPKERQSLFSGVLGGPIYLPRFGEGGPGLWSGKDRLFFFFSYEGLRLQQPQSKVTLVPSASIRTAPTTPAILKPFLSASPLPNGQDFGNGSAQLAASYSDPANFNIFGLRIDGNITKSLTGFFRFNHAPSEAAQRGTNISSILHTNTLNDTYTGGVTWLVSKELTADLRANWTSNVVKSFLDLDILGSRYNRTTKIIQIEK
jgi:hypothetical protein